ncbi:hypothetical protein NDA11_003954 [Ustilago hordei]|nr:hypothetical protein NDA11_003954 [Ustilago hordei]
MVVTKDPLDEASDSGDGRSGNTEPEQEDMDLRPYQQHMDSDFDHEEEQDDDDDEGNIVKYVSRPVEAKQYWSSQEWFKTILLEY